MISKKELIHNLKNVKLVIGNGFDLHCGLKTKYSDYFLYYNAKYEYIKKWIISFGSEIIANRFIVKPFYELGGTFERFDEVNIWDIIFEILSDEESFDFRWCDIETAMIDCLTDSAIDKIKIPHQKVNLLDVYNTIQDPDIDIDGVTPNFLALVTFVFRKRDFKSFADETDYYEFLLNELRKFEINFGKYIKRQHDYFDNFINHHNSDYDYKATETIKLLCNVDNLISIDKHKKVFDI